MTEQGRLRNEPLATCVGNEQKGDYLRKEYRIMLSKYLAVTAMVGILSVDGANARAESPSIQLEKGIYTEETVGDIDKAIEIYKNIITEAQTNRRYVIEAQYRLGMCYLKKGDKVNAEAALKRVLSDPPEQNALHTRARQQLVKLGAAGGGAPLVIATNPPSLANDVSPLIDKITATFDQPMTDNSWSWTGGGKTFPKTTGKPYYDAERRTCTLPVKLEPGMVYCLGINSPSHQNFASIKLIPARRHLILFATKTADGKPTPLPEDLAQQTRDVNAPPPVVVRTTPAAFSEDVSPGARELSVAFSREMMDRSWSWTFINRDMFPKTTGKPSYNASRTTCSLPVELQPGRVYWVGINGQGQRFFQTPMHVCADSYAILFATKTADGQPTPIQKDLLQRAKDINAGLPDPVERAPRVIRAVPDNGQRNVDPSVNEIRVTFDQDMATNGYSWVGGGPKYPKTRGKPRWVDSRTCVLPVGLEPNHDYWLSINSQRFKNFQSKQGVPADPYPIEFTTGGAPAAAPPKS
jgi:hypothetical protein